MVQFSGGRPPLSMLRPHPRGCGRTTRDRGGSLRLPRDGLAPSNLCQSPRRTKIKYQPLHLIPRWRKPCGPVHRGQRPPIDEVIEGCIIPLARRSIIWMRCRCSGGKFPSQRRFQLLSVTFCGDYLLAPNQMVQANHISGSEAILTTTFVSC